LAFLFFTAGRHGLAALRGGDATSLSGQTCCPGKTRRQRLQPAACGDAAGGVFQL